MVCNFSRLLAHCIFIKRLPNKLCVLFIYFPSFIFNFVAVCNLTACVISLFQTFTHTTLDLLAKLGRIILRHTFKHAFHQNSAGIVRNIFSCRQHSHSVFLKFHFVVCTVIPVPSKPVKLIHQHILKIFFLAVLNHLQESRPSVGRP